MTGTLCEHMLKVPNRAKYDKRREDIAKEKKVPVEELNYFHGLLPSQTPQGSFELNMALLACPRGTTKYAKKEAKLISSLTPDQIQQRCKGLGTPGKYKAHLQIALADAKAKNNTELLKTYTDAIEKLSKPRKSKRGSKAE